MSSKSYNSKKDMPAKNPSLKIISNCPVCKAVYYPSEINIIDEKENAHLLHLQCRKCKNNLLVLIVAGQRGINSVGLLTDLQSHETMKFLESHPVCADEVLEAKYLISRPIKFLETIRD